MSEGALSIRSVSLRIPCFPGRLDIGVDLKVRRTIADESSMLASVAWNGEVGAAAAGVAALWRTFCSLFLFHDPIEWRK